MAERDYVSTPVADELGLADVVTGLAGDLEALRKGEITPHEALARAAVAKQVFNGVRLYIQGAKMIAAAAKTVSPPPEELIEETPK